MKPPKYIFLAAVAMLFAVRPACANQVSVQEIQVSPAQVATISVTGFYTGGVLAGINKLLVGGTLMDGFCIDPFHFSSDSALLYTVAPLSTVPKAPGTMNPAKATEIEKLWAMYYDPNMSATNAAGFQMAIWEIVAGSQMTVIGSDYNAGAMLEKMSAYTGAGADLVGLTGPGQDYVVQRTAALSVPDRGATLALLGMASLALLSAGTMQAKRTGSLNLG